KAPTFGFQCVSSVWTKNQCGKCKHPDDNTNRLITSAKILNEQWQGRQRHLKAEKNKKISQTNEHEVPGPTFYRLTLFFRTCLWMHLCFPSFDSELYYTVVRYNLKEANKGKKPET